MDTDKDKSLDAQELAAAPARLKSRDADDNDVLDAAEITGQPQTGAVRVAVDSRAVQAAVGAVLLGPAATQDGVYILILQRYKNADDKLAAGCFPQFPALFAALDKDGDGKIAAGEILGLNDVPPHVELTVDLAVRRAGEGLKFKSLGRGATEAQRAAKDGQKPNASEGLPSRRAARRADFAGRQRQRGVPAEFRVDRGIAAGAVRRQRQRLPGSHRKRRTSQFELFDENEDGKAYPAEITAGYARQYAPQATQVVANVVNQGNSLFQTLDASGDGRLGLRELRAAAERIAALDKNADGVIGGTEIPETINVTFALGGNSPAGLVVRLAGAMPGAAAPRPASGGPEWFTRMDRNGDGDVTLKEFLGDEADFKRLDTNGDGFLSRRKPKRRRRSSAGCRSRATPVIRMPRRKSTCSG